MSEAREYVEPVPVESKDLSHHLRDQMRLLELTPRQQLLAEEFIGNIAEDGYLGASPEEIVRGANQLLEEHAVEAEGDEKPQLFTLAEAEEMLRIIQKLDPPGVGARDLRECLLLQLEARNETGTLAYRLVKEAFEDLKAHRWSDLGKRFSLDRKITRLNSSHSQISYAVFCLKKKKKHRSPPRTPRIRAAANDDTIARPARHPLPVRALPCARSREPRKSVT